LPSPVFSSMSKRFQPTASTPARDASATVDRSSFRRIAMRSLQRRVDPPRALTVFLAAGVLIAGDISCREREKPGEGDRVEFKVGSLTATYFRTLAAVQDRLWVTTNGGIAVIDPVAETWTMPVLGSHHL